MTKKWGIVGGGMLGMALAQRIAQQGHSVTLLESASQLGGMASAWQLGDLTWDRHYHVTLLSDLHLRKLLNEIGLEEDMRWVETRTGFYTDGQLYSMSNSMEFLRFPPLGFLDKVRLGATIFYASKLKNWKRLENIPVEQWLRQLSGDRTTERIWLPLLRAKLGDNYQKASAAFIWAIIARMYAARRTKIKKEMFGYLPGGYARILECYAKYLTDRNVDIRTQSRVASIQRNSFGKQIVTMQQGRQLEFDEVIVTTAPPLAAKICKDLSPDERARLENLDYQGIVCASVLLKKPLADYYVTNITESWVPFTAVIEMTALVNPQEFGGRSLVYLPKYVDSKDPALEQPDSVFRKSFLDALGKMYPHFEQEDVLTFQVSRVRHVLPISTLGYSSSVLPIRTSSPGLALINASHIINGTLNVNETLQLADQLFPLSVRHSLDHPALAA